MHASSNETTSLDQQNRPKQSVHLQAEWSEFHRSCRIGSNRIVRDHRILARPKLNFFTNWI